MDWLSGLLSMCVQRTEHAGDKQREDGPLLEALIPPGIEAPPPKGEEESRAAYTPKTKANMKQRLKKVDIVLAGTGLWAACWALGFFQTSFGVPLFAPPMMASGIIFFAGPAPPSPKPFLVGTIGSATLALGALLLFSNILPPIAAQGSAAGMLLIWYKTTNTLFPPAAALVGSLMVAFAGAAASAENSHPGLMAIFNFLAFPWLTGHAWLYIVAMIMSKVRGRARVHLAAAGFSSTEKFLTNKELMEIFKKFDTSGDGQLDAEELKVALRVALGIDLSADDCEAMISQYDKDGTRTVDFDEFIMIYRT
mmetsp:Transcript_58024/g.115069  ORF Transcript_58024/g.115069 Transcript_58024/m.115069 type:complete len:309 (+) Transcript_58024:74-1000(+)